MREKISFLVTYYNQEKYVEKSLNSIFSQKLDFDYEVLVGDDGSSDNTIRVVKSFQERYPDKLKLFIMDRDLDKKYDSIERVSKNRINLIKNATGNYFCILDGDDWYCTNELINKGAKFLSNNNTYGIYAYAFQFVYPDERIEVSKNRIKEGVITEKTYLRKYYTHAGACVFRNFLNSNIFDLLEQANFFDDCDIVYLALNYGKLFYSSEILYAYRQVESSLWHSLSIIEQYALILQSLDIWKLYIPKYVLSLLLGKCDCIVYSFLHRNELKSVVDNNLKYKNWVSKYKEGYLSLLYNWQNLNTIKRIEFILQIFPLCIYKLIKKIIYSIRNH